MIPFFAIVAGLVATIACAEVVQVDVEAQDELQLQRSIYQSGALPTLSPDPTADRFGPHWRGEGGSLQEIGRACGTDKATLHGYLEFYEVMFARTLRKDPIKILDLGVLRGASLCMWGNYFSSRDAQIFGLDIEISEEAIQVANSLQERYLRNDNVPSVILMKMNLNNMKYVREMAEQHGPFDIIVDDALHSMYQQQNLLATLLPYLKGNGTGFYVLEDLATSFIGSSSVFRYNEVWRQIDDYENHKTTIQLLYHLLDPSEEPFNATYISREDVEYLQREVSYISLQARRFRPSACARTDDGIPRRSTTAVIHRR